CRLSFPFTRLGMTNPWSQPRSYWPSAVKPTSDLLFALVVVGFRSLGDDLFGAFPKGDPLPAVGVVAGVATRVIRNHIVDEIFVVRGEELMGLTRAEVK